MASAAPRPDASKWSVPESITHLYYAPIYQTLTREQRLVYNRLHACFCCEMLVFFEEELPECYSIAARDGAASKSVSADVQAMLASESRHAAMFRALARDLDPSLYEPFDYHFLRMPRGILRLMKLPLHYPKLFPLVFWIVLLQEERTVYYSREVIRHASDLDPRVVDAFSRHLDDEQDHLGIDESMLEIYWDRSSPWIRRLNGYVFGLFVDEFLNAPKRAGVRVIERLAQEVPSLKSRKRELTDGLLGLARDTCFHQSLYSREIVPKTFALFDRYAEFRRLGDRLHGYSPGGAA
jgi:hypothetical protein